MKCSRGILYSEYHVAFLDILGFKNLAMSTQLSKKKIICKYFNLINTTIKDINRNILNININSIVISDSVILSVLTETENQEKIQTLRQICRAIQIIQFKLAKMNLWLRGGISSGEAYFNSNENQVVGPAYVNAYLLEENVAIHPRVILDNNLIKILNVESAQELVEIINNEGPVGSEYNFIKRNILFRWTFDNFRKLSLGKDVALFVDYLVYAFEDIQNLETIINNIKSDIYTNNNIYNKFRWVSDYLLASLEFHIERGCDIDPLDINKIYHKLKMI